MAEKTLRLFFENDEEPSKRVSLTIPMCDDTKDAATVAALMTTISTNKAIFDRNIGAPKEAAYVTPASLTYIEDLFAG